MNARSYDDYVLQIIRQGSLTKAAAALGISQPALSSGLTNLESEMGFKVFNRRTTPVSLTPEGRLYVDYIHRLGTLSEDFARRLDDLRRDSGNTVIVGGPIAYMESLVTDAAIRLLEQNPLYSVELKTASLHELIDMAGKGEVNCFIATTDRLPDSMEYHFVKRERFYLCVPKGDPINARLADGGAIDYGILDGGRFICLESAQPLQARLERFAGEYGIALDNRIRVNQVSTAVAFVAKGWGMCFASEDSLCGVDMSNISLYALPESISDRGIYVAYDRELYRPEACEAFIRLLRTDDSTG